MNRIFCQLIKIDELDAIKITHPLFHATLLLQGAQLIEFSPKENNFENILWLSNSAKYQQGKPIRGGIPICWPWFGNLEKNPENIQSQVHSINAPAHGLVRDINWDIKTIEESCENVIIELELLSNKELQKIWPFEFSLKARFNFSHALSLELTTENTGEDDFAFSQALHTYLPTEDISRTYIHNAHQTKYIDALDNWKSKTQIGRIAFNQETDRLYFFNKDERKDSDNQEFELRVESPGHQLNLKTSNSLSAVIWNPWIDKSQRLSQFSPWDYQTMYCIESANVMEDHKTIAPKEKSSVMLQLRK